jgi:hypothetical protein
MLPPPVRGTVTGCVPGTVTGPGPVTAGAGTTVTVTVTVTSLPCGTQAGPGPGRQARCPVVSDSLALRPDRSRTEPASEPE